MIVCHAHRLDRLRALRAGPDPASRGTGARAGAAESAHAVGAAGQCQPTAARSRSGWWARSTRAPFRRLRARRPRRGRSRAAQALGRRAALRASAGLPLLRHAAREAALERGAAAQRPGHGVGRAARARNPRLRHRRARIAGARRRVQRSHRRDGRRQVDPGRRHRAPGRRPRRCRRGPRRRRARGAFR